MRSIWQAEYDRSRPHFPHLEGDAKTDVLIIGGGMAGVLCAHFLAHAGVDCMLAEAEQIGDGITKNTTAKVTSQHRLLYADLQRQKGKAVAERYFRLQEDAIGEYRRLCDAHGCEFLEEDLFVYDTKSREKLEQEAEVLRSFGANAEVVGRIELPISVAGALKRAGQGQIHPLRFLNTVAEGLPIYEHTRILRVRGTDAATDRGVIHAKRIIFATHFPFLNRHGSYFLKMYQSRSYVLELEGAGLDGMYLDAASNGLTFCTVGDHLLIGGGSHRTGKDGGAWGDAERFADMHYPDAKRVSRWATQDCMSLDGFPYVGNYSGLTPNWYVATGFCKWGMTSSMMAAKWLAEHILGKSEEHFALISPSRSMLRAQLAVNAYEAASSLLRLTPRRCPHMGCALQWNSREHTWDCPCHGSRFDEAGHLIDNPAVRDLKNK